MNYASRVIVSRNKEVLVGMRQGGVEAGKWNILGGKVDANEPPELAAKRELREESGIELTDLRPFVEVESNNWTTYFFYDFFNGELINHDGEHSQFAWLTEAELDQLEQQLAFNHYLILKQFFALFETLP